MISDNTRLNHGRVNNNARHRRLVIQSELTKTGIVPIERFEDHLGLSLNHLQLENAAEPDFMKDKSVVPAPFNGPGAEDKAGADNQKFVDAKDLLKLLWAEASRPSLRWLREQQARRAIPFVKLGARVWFDPTEVKHHLKSKWTVRQRG